MEMRLAAGREPAEAPDQLRPGKRSPDERSDIRGGVGVVPDAAVLIRATCYGGSDANGNAAFKPRLPLNLAEPVVSGMS